MSNTSRLLSGLIALAILPVPVGVEANILKNILREAARSRPQSGQNRTENRARYPMPSRFGSNAVNHEPDYTVSPEEELLAGSVVEYQNSTGEVDRLDKLLRARKAVAYREKRLCAKRSYNCSNDPGGHVDRFYVDLLASVQSYIDVQPMTYAGLIALRQVQGHFESYSFYKGSREAMQEARLGRTVGQMVEPRRLEIEAPLRSQIVADIAGGKSGLLRELFGSDEVRERDYGQKVADVRAGMKAPGPATNEGKILAAALKSLHEAPGFAFARSTGVLERTPISVRFAAAGVLRHDYTVDVRNAKCQPVKSGTSCSYDMKLGVDMAVMGFQMPQIKSEWFQRRDVFIAKGGEYFAADLKLAMEKVVQPRISSSYASSGGGYDSIAANKNHNDLMQNVSDVRSGMYSTGTVIYGK